MSHELPGIEQVVKDLRSAPDASSAHVGTSLTDHVEEAGSVSAVASAPADASATETTLKPQAPVQTGVPDFPAPRGFQSSFVAQPQWPRKADAESPGFSSPKPMPKRPKGRFLIGAMLFAICCSVGWAIWDSFVGVAAYGVMTGDTLRVAAPWDGQLKEIHVKEGQSVEAGQLLATVVSPEVKRQIERTKDELKIERAKLDAESSRIRWDSNENAAEYFELWGSLQKSRQDLLRLEREHKRARDVGEFIAKEDVERLGFAESGLRELIAKLETAVEKRRQRAEPAHDEEPEAGWDQLQPVLARIEYLQAELFRLEEQLHEGALRSPVAGVVTKVHHMDGQRVASLETILDLVDTNSLEATLYMPQDESRTLPPGTDVTLCIEPLDQKQIYTVVGARERFESAPPAVRRYYLSDEQLMPVLLRPKSPVLAPAESGIQIGAVVRLTWVNHLGIKHGEKINNLKQVVDESRTAALNQIRNVRFQ